jgi:Uma2 family endonuclease
MSIATQQPAVEMTPEVELTPPPASPPRQVEPLPLPADRLYRMSLDQYRKLAESGILGDARVELIQGVIVKKMTKGDPHIIVTELLTRILARLMPDGWFVSLQNPITLDESASEPEPDAKVVRGEPRDYKQGRRVRPADTALVIEVGDSSVRDDQVVKKAVYARASIPIYWIVNLPANRIEVYSDPTGPDPTPDYRHRADLGPGDQIPLILDGREIARIAVADLLP